MARFSRSADAESGSELSMVIENFAKARSSPVRPASCGFISSSGIWLGRAVYGVKSGFDVNALNIGSAARSNRLSGDRPRICSIVRYMLMIEKKLLSTWACFTYGLEETRH